jgi:N-methylhydantoinase A
LANAYILPLMDAYLARFEARFQAAGLSCPVLMMTASGGMCTLEQARQFPIRLVESGPAGGAILAARVAQQIDADAVLSFDMGGTTAKLCLIDNARPQTARSFEISRASRFIKGSGMPVRIPVIEMIEIGAGGGSIASVDGLGRLAVGPQSAGSEPGPVAFGRGGQHPTVTDSDVSLGYIQPDSFAEGHLQLDRAAARSAINKEIAQALGTSESDAALGISQIVDENMGAAARMHAVESGKDLAARTMIAFGGNGPLHATRVARACSVTRIVIPPGPGVGSAVGFIYAPVSYESVRSQYHRLGALDFKAVNALLTEMEAAAHAVIDAGAKGAERVTHRAAFMRYAGQGHEIEVALPNEPLTSLHIPGLIDAFEAAYQEQFSRAVPGMEIEVLNWSVVWRPHLLRNFLHVKHMKNKQLHRSHASRFSVI